MKITKDMLLMKSDPITTWNVLGFMHKIRDREFTLIAHNLKTGKRVTLGTFKNYTLRINSRVLECTNTNEENAFGVEVSTDTTHKFKMEDDIDFIFVVDDEEFSLNDYKEVHDSTIINPDILRVGDFVRLDVLFGSFEYEGTAIVDDVARYGVYFLIHDLDDLDQHEFSITDLEDPRLHFDCELLHEAENPYAHKKG